jgi:hypothetical protein
MASPELYNFFSFRFVVSSQVCRCAVCFRIVVTYHYTRLGEKQVIITNLLCYESTQDPCSSGTSPSSTEMSSTKTPPSISALFRGISKSEHIRLKSGGRGAVIPKRKRLLPPEGL